MQRLGQPSVQIYAYQVSDLRTESICEGLGVARAE